MPSPIAAIHHLKRWWTEAAPTIGSAGSSNPAASYLANSDAFDCAIAEFSESYADQNERGYDALVQAEKDGRITVQRGL